jgi:polysaccharide chain length determinant protein (PEP-CTERM system associated)
MDGGLLKGVLYEQTLSYARQLWRYKWLSIGLAWLICVIGWPVVTLLPPKYESSARIYVNADQFLTPLLRGLAADVDLRRQVEFLQRTLLSRPNLEQVIHLSDLDLSSRGKVGEKEREERLRRLAQEVLIKPQTANLITITYQNPEPAVAKNIVQALLTVFAENSAGGNRKETENAKRFIDQQIQSYEAQLRAAEQRRAEFREKYIDLLPGADGAASRLEVGRAAVTRLTLDFEDARAKRDSFQSELRAVPKTLTADAAAPQVIVAGKATGARARLEEARAKLEELGARFTARHPDIIALRQQIGVLEAQAAKEPAGGGDASGGRKTQIANPVYDKVKLSLVDAETVLASAERRLKQAEQEQQVLEDKARATPGVQAQAQDLDRDYAVKKKNFDELLQRREQARIGEAADTTADKIQFRIIDPPQVPVVPVAPNQPLLLSGVLAAAIAGAIGVPLLLIQFDHTYASVTALRTLGVPVLGTVSWLAFPGGRRRERIQVAALCASATVLLVVYGLLLTLSASLYRLSFV